MSEESSPGNNDADCLLIKQLTYADNKSSIFFLQDASLDDSSNENEEIYTVKHLNENEVIDASNQIDNLIIYHKHTSNEFAKYKKQSVIHNNIVY